MIAPSGRALAAVSTSICVVLGFDRAWLPSRGPTAHRPPPLRAPVRQQTEGARKESSSTRPACPPVRQDVCSGSRRSPVLQRSTQLAIRLLVLESHRSRQIPTISVPNCEHLASQEGTSEKEAFRSIVLQLFPTAAGSRHIRTLVLCQKADASGAGTRRPLATQYSLRQSHERPFVNESPQVQKLTRRSRPTVLLRHHRGDSSRAALLNASSSNVMVASS
jgi:hypothetical protein